MFLKRLEIQGFKSFPEKIKLDFKEGITAVVGPNGSGKSNISDAIRWVIGEQSAKSLRGEKMEDIIFAGTKNRKPLGFAEVSIVLDNSDKKINIEFDEVSITRKVYRNGDSSYYINGTTCRLRDIQELFMDTGIGKEGYSIIGQGKIDAILSNKSEDRRALFEEAVGIVKFKNRKASAENKLNETKQNLIRTNDIINEIENQLEPLRQQAEKTKKYLSLSEKLKVTRLNLFIHQYKNSSQEITTLENIINDVLEKCNELEREKEKFIDFQNQFKKDIVKIEEELQNIDLSSKNLVSSINENENKINLNIQTINFIQEEINRLNKEIKDNSLNIQTKKDNIKITETSLKAKELELLLKTDLEKKLAKEFEDKNILFNKNKNIIDEYTLKISEKMNSFNSLKGKVVELGLYKSQFKEQQDQYINSINVIKSSLNERQVRKEVLDIELAKLKQKETEINDNILSKVNLTNELNLKLKNLFKEKEKLHSQYVFLENRKKVLLQLEENFEGYNNSVKFILKELQQGRFSGVCGAIGKIIKVEPKFETAIEISLGSSIQNIVTKTENDAKVVIEYLKERNKGRATFLPISSIKPKSLSHNKEDFLKEKGFLGVASELVCTSSEYLDIISYLLGRVIIFDTLDNAISFSKKYKYSYKVVTLDGDVVNSSGALTGGSIFKKETSIFSRDREINDIDNSILNIQKQTDEISRIQKINQQELENLNIFINEQKQNFQDLHIIKAETSTKAQENDEYLKELSEKINTQEQTLELYKDKFDEYTSSAERYEKELEEVELEINDLQQELYNFQKESTSHKEFAEEKTKEINELKIEINSILYEITTSKNEISRLETEIKDIEEKQVIFEEQINQNNDKSKYITNKNDTITLEIENLKKEHQKIAEKYEYLQQEKTKINNEIQKYTEEHINLTTKISNLNNEKNKLELKKQNTETYMKQISDSIWEDYEITYAAACSNFFDEQQSFENLKVSEKELKREINSLGQVNVLAVDEYNLLKERYNLNVTQRDDIIKADQNLRDIISQLMNEMEQQFKEQFKLINENFGLVFSQIFGGGTAKLVLADKENVLTSGIDIIAQPPGKNLQSLTLLSGGERTLTAVSLLFSILKLKPSPFCILDETEAALDDANVIRYANFLKKFSNENQFIVITHKVGTMEIADTLYGVTMEEQGVSKLISVKLNEATNL